MQPNPSRPRRPTDLEAYPRTPPVEPLTPLHTPTASTASAPRGDFFSHPKLGSRPIPIPSDGTRPRAQTTAIPIPNTRTRARTNSTDMAMSGSSIITMPLPDNSTATRPTLFSTLDGGASGRSSRSNSNPDISAIPYTTLSAEKKASNYAKIPLSWRLPLDKIPRLPNPDKPGAPPFDHRKIDVSSLNVLNVPRTCGILTQHELDITEHYTAQELVSTMAEGKLKCEDVVTAFCKRAAIAHQLVNCLTEIMFDEAIEKAKALDRFWEVNGPAGVVGKELWGLPVSLKDSFNVKDVPTTIGYTSFLSHPPATHNSHLVSLLRDRGAIFYCKTNLPQTMMTADSHNNVFGRTLNPHNISLTAGGSTGGEGALVAMRGSVLGMTTDVAGSTRIPALCNGVKGFKPTAGRIPFGGGVAPGRLGSPTSIMPVVGALGHSMRDIELFMRTVIDAEPWLYDENVLAVPWRRVEPFARKLRFGVIRGHRNRPLHPPVAHALTIATAKLTDAGHEQLEIEQDMIPDLWDSAVLAWKYFLLDPKKTAAKFVEAGNEPWVPSILTAKFRELNGWAPSLDGLFEMNVARAKICKAYHDLVVGNELDYILMPGYQATAVKHDAYGVPIYTYPAGILPVGKANQAQDKEFFDETADFYEPPYMPADVEGAPTAVQIVGKPMKDEELIEIMKVVEGILESKAPELTERTTGKLPMPKLPEQDMQMLPN